MPSPRTIEINSLPRIAAMNEVEKGLPGGASEDYGKVLRRDRCWLFRRPNHRFGHLLRRSHRTIARILTAPPRSLPGSPPLSPPLRSLLRRLYLCLHCSSPLPRCGDRVRQHRGERGERRRHRGREGRGGEGCGFWWRGVRARGGRRATCVALCVG